MSTLHPNAHDTQLLLYPPGPAPPGWPGRSPKDPLARPLLAEQLGGSGKKLQTRKQFQELETPVLEQGLPAGPAVTRGSGLAAQAQDSGMAAPVPPAPLLYSA